MNVSTAIETRRSIKAFDADYRMSQTEIDRLMSLAMLSPTAFNIQNWRFVVLQDPALRLKVRAVSWDQAQVTDASILVVLVADLKSWEKQPQRYWKDAPKPVQDFLVPAIDLYYRDKEQVQRDEGMRSCGMAAMTLMLAAKEMGYDSCPMDGFDFEGVARLIRMPADHAICMMVTIGKRVQEPRPRGGQLMLDEVFFTDHF